MFTGLIEAVCSVVSVRQTDSSICLTLDLGPLADCLHIGDSIAVNGACLTVAAIKGKTAAFDVSSETLSKSTIAKLAAGSKVNVELALRADSRLGGHFVSGHVDGTATIEKIEKKNRFAVMTFSADKELLDNIIDKGSVAVNGISLTIAESSETAFSVALIPQTLEKTTLAEAKTGDTVNIETDLIVKAVKKLLDKIIQKQDLTVEKLQDLGF